jgi:ADP-ribosylglycohydrolase
MNAAIVGGLIGALHGKNNPPKHHVEVFNSSMNDTQASHFKILEYSELMKEEVLIN